jgi:hypothetical protein
MEKRILIAAAILCMAFAFVGCQSDTTDTPETTEIVEESVVPTTEETEEVETEEVETEEVETEEAETEEVETEESAEPEETESTPVESEATADSGSDKSTTTSGQTSTNKTTDNSSTQSQNTSNKTSDKNTSTNNNNSGTTSNNSGTTSNKTTSDKNTSDKTTTNKVTETSKPATHTHSYTSSVTKAATCSTAGVRTYTCSCGNSYTESIAATGSHNWVEQTKTVHHDEVGHYEETGHYEKVKTGCKGYYTCNKCGYSEEPVNGSISDDFALHVLLTCDSSYSLIYQDVYETQWVSDGKQWVVDTKAYDETVSNGYKCSVCGATK